MRLPHLIMTLAAAAVITLSAPITSAPIEAFAADTAQPGGPRHFTKTGKFDDVFQDLQDAVIGKGLVIDYVGHVDKMLARTSEAVGSVTDKGSASPYLHAKYVLFCSAKLTHQSVSANPFNLSICPFIVFAFETKTEPGKIVVGYRRPIAGPSKLTRAAFAAVDKLLEDVAKEATEE